MTVAPETGNEPAPKEGEDKQPEDGKQPEAKQPDKGGEDKSADQRAAELEAENNRLKRTISERDKADRKAAEKKAADEGKHEEAARLAQERAEKAETDLQAERRTTRGLKIAGELKFNNPTIALKLIDADQLDDDKAAKAALEKLASDEPGLLAETTRRRSAQITEGDAPNADMNAQLRKAFGRG